MAILSFQEKELIETVFCMKGGYVLDFTNQQFKEFMKDVVSYNIFKFRKLIDNLLLGI